MREKECPLMCRKKPRGKNYDCQKVVNRLIMDKLTIKSLLAPKMVEVRVWLRNFFKIFTKRTLTFLILLFLEVSILFENNKRKRESVEVAEEHSRKRRRLLRNSQLSVTCSQNSGSSINESNYQPSVGKTDSDLSMPENVKLLSDSLFEHIKKLLCCNDTTRSTKIQILTLLPPDWSRFRILESFKGVTWRMAETAIDIRETRGLLGLPDEKRGI